jgi:WD40 repeat protein
VPRERIRSLSVHAGEGVMAALCVSGAVYDAPAPDGLSPVRWRRLGERRPGRARLAGFSADGSKVLSITGRSTVRVFDRKGEAGWEFEAGSGVVFVTFTHGRLVVLTDEGTLEAGSKDGERVILHAGTADRAWQSFLGVDWAIVPSERGAHAVALDHGRASQNPRLLAPYSTIVGSGLAQADDVAVLIDLDRRVTLWDPETGRNVTPQALRGIRAFSVGGCRGDYVALENIWPDRLQVVDLKGGSGWKEAVVVAHSHLEFSGDGKVLVTVDLNGDFARAWSVRDARELLRIQGKGIDRCFQVRAGLLVCRSDGELQLYM